MIQEFNEPDLSSMVIPEPDLSILTPLERSIFGSYIRRRYYDQAVKYKDKMKKDLYYNGMKYILRNYEDRFIALPLLLLMIIVALMMFIMLSTGRYFKWEMTIVFHDFWLPLAFFTCFCLILHMPILILLRRTQMRHRDANGIPHHFRINAQ